MVSRLPQFEHKSATEMPQNLRKYRVSLCFPSRYSWPISEEQLAMPIFENRILSKALSDDNQHEASTKLSTQAFEYTAVAALAATTLLIASKGRVLPELAFAGESAVKSGLR
ncbi:MAG: hypothetical protein C0508_01050, partial [Cyanobacteria bacterium PR.023]|nr:hypothetical protein [Cyanobacteria bacterium PR.023]